MRRLEADVRQALAGETAPGADTGADGRGQDDDDTELANMSEDERKMVRLAKSGPVLSVELQEALVKVQGDVRKLSSEHRKELKAAEVKRDIDVYDTVREQYKQEVAEAELEDPVNMQSAGKEVIDTYEKAFNTVSAHLL